MPRIKYLNRHEQESSVAYLLDKKFKPKEAAEILGMSPHTLKKKRGGKDSPDYIKTGYRTVFYLGESLARYMKEHHFPHTTAEQARLSKAKTDNHRSSKNVALSSLNT
jgi:hypothetical protein